MPLILVAADADWVHDDIRAALVSPGFEVIDVFDGATVTPTVVARRPDLVIADLQIGNMGGFAVVKDLQLEASAGRAPEVAVLMLLDRQADVFLAGRASVEHYLVKPFDPGTLRRTVKRLLAGQSTRSARRDTLGAEAAGAEA